MLPTENTARKINCASGNTWAKMHLQAWIQKEKSSCKKYKVDPQQKMNKSMLELKTHCNQCEIKNSGEAPHTSIMRLLETFPPSRKKFTRNATNHNGLVETTATRFERELIQLRRPLPSFISSSASILEEANGFRYSISVVASLSSKRMHLFNVATSMATW